MRRESAVSSMAVSRTSFVRRAWLFVCEPMLMPARCISDSMSQVGGGLLQEKVEAVVDRGARRAERVGDGEDGRGDALAPEDREGVVVDVGVAVVERHGAHRLLEAAALFEPGPDLGKRHEAEAPPE